MRRERSTPPCRGCSCSSRVCTRAGAPVYLGPALRPVAQRHLNRSRYLTQSLQIAATLRDYEDTASHRYPRNSVGGRRQPIKRERAGAAIADNVILITLDGARIDEVFGGMQVGILQSTLAEEKGRGARPLSPLLVRLARRPPGEADAVLLEDADGRARVDCGKPRPRKRRPVEQYAQVFVSGLRRNSSWRAARRRHQQQRSHAQSVHDRARGNARSAEISNRSRSPPSARGHTSMRSRSIPRARRSSMRGKNRCPAPSISFSTRCRPRRRYRGTRCGTTRSRSRWRWPSSRPTGHASCIWRLARPMIGRTTGATIASSKRTRVPIGTWRSCGTGWRVSPNTRGRTHVLITTDHGRGRSAQDWRDHGATIEGAQDVWMAFASPKNGAPRRMAITRAVVDQSDRRDTGGMDEP